MPACLSLPKRRTAVLTVVCWTGIVFLVDPPPAGRPRSPHLFISFLLSALLCQFADLAAAGAAAAAAEVERGYGHGKWRVRRLRRLRWCSWRLSPGDLSASASELEVHW